MISDISLWSYLYTELTRGYYLENDEAKFAEKRQRVYAFMKIPRELEKFMAYGFFQCVDAFLYMFTFLPVRFLMAILKLTFKGCLHTWCVYIEYFVKHIQPGTCNCKTIVTKINTEPRIQCNIPVYFQSHTLNNIESSVFLIQKAIMACCEVKDNRLALMTLYCQ